MIQNMRRHPETLLQLKLRSLIIYFFGHLRAAQQALNTRLSYCHLKVDTADVLANSCLTVHPANMEQYLFGLAFFEPPGKSKSSIHSDFSSAKLLREMSGSLVAKCLSVPVAFGARQVEFREFHWLETLKPPAAVGSGVDESREGETN